MKYLPILFLLAACSMVSVPPSGAQSTTGPASTIIDPLSKLADIPNLLANLLMRNMRTADNNLHLAVNNGDLKADDPAIACFDGMVGTQNPNAQAYDSSNAGGRLSMLYITANSIQNKVQGSSTSCDALIGKFAKDIVKNATPFGGGLLPGG